jgi:ubiquinone/menaquinone biosynthesis C-methylase UbiE
MNNDLFNFDLTAKKNAGAFNASLQKHFAARQVIRENLAPIMDAFSRHLQSTMGAVHERSQKAGFDPSQPAVQVDYDPQSDPERFKRDGWDVWSTFWPLIETPAAYHLTMMTILEKLRIPPTGNFRLVSVGSGPGVYEVFLARILDSICTQSSVTCLDFAPKMAEMVDFIANINPPSLRNIHAVTGDMAEMPLPDACADAVLCNNSLQWSPRWSQALGHMARILDPRGTRLLYLVIHTHKAPMQMLDANGKQVLNIQVITPEEVMDELERHSFTVCSSRQIRGGRDTGQLGGSMERAFVVAQFNRGGPKYSWRKRPVEVRGADLVRIG